MARLLSIAASEVCRLSELHVGATLARAIIRECCGLQRDGARRHIDRSSRKLPLVTGFAREISEKALRIKPA